MAERSSARALGFWSAIGATLLLIVSSVTLLVGLPTTSLVAGFALTLVFVTLMGSIHAGTEPGLKALSTAALAFAAVYATLISFNYFVQLTFVPRGAFDTTAWSADDPNSMMWVIEILGYFFMGLSTLAAAPLFRGTFLDRIISWLFVVNGLLGAGGLVGYARSWDLRVMLGGLVVWSFLMPLATALVAIRFRRSAAFPSSSVPS